ncbi:MAG: sodium/proline symporter [Halanaeroarchaeum sp.]
MVELSTITFAIYMAAVFLIGIYGYLATTNFADFSIGGRRMKHWVVGLSAQASDMSMWLLVGLPATAYVMGLPAIWIGIGIVLGTGFNWYVLSKRMRRYTGLLDSMTVLDFLEERVRDNYGFIKLFGSVSLVVFFSISTAGEFIGSGKVSNAVFGFDFFTGTLLGAGLVLVYTLIGGYIAVSYTDVLQAIVMLGAVLILPLVGFAGIGSVAGGLDALAAANTSASISLFGAKSGALALIGFLSGTLGIGIGYPGQPHILVRYMSIDDHRNLRRSSLLGMVWVTLAVYGSIFMGWAAGAHLGGVESTDQIMPMLSMELLPGWLVGILVAGAFAGMMSTSDSKFLVATNAVAYNIYARFIDEDASDRAIMVVSRATLVVIIGVAVWMASPSGQVFNVILGGWGGIGASFGPVIIASLYWKRLTKLGAYAGIIVGMVTVAGWITVNLGALNVLYALVPGFVLSSIAVVVVSLLDSPPSDAIQDEFETAVESSGLEVDESAD